MAMILCPRCREMISDQAVRCVHCGYQLQQSGDVCRECGRPLEGTEQVCPDCGCPVGQTRHGAHGKKKKRHTLRNVIVAVVVIFLAVMAYSSHLYNRSISYYETVDEIYTARNASVDAVNECASLVQEVWYNAIWQESDPRTDPYTCPNGTFVEDFNTALNNLYEDPDFCEQLDLIDTQQQELRRLEKQLPEPPEGMEEYSELMQDMLDNHIELSMLILNPSGSYDSVSQEFGELFREANEIVMELDSYEQ